MSLTRRKFLQSSTAVTAAAMSGGCQTLGTAVTDEPAGGRWREPVRKPNILLAVLDDVGFGDLRCYGSDVPTACMDELAANGVRYNNFHVTSLCAPTRASLLTGLNAHAAGVGNIAEWGRDHPGYRGWIRNDVRTLPEILGPSGYRCYAAGKWHLSTVAGRNATGPFDQWPTGRGFDHWYGFLGAAADHWHPELFRNRTATYPDKTGGYHLTEDLVDRAMGFVRDHLVASAAEPFFLYLAFGACHFPYHVPPEFMARHRGRYDAGWDAIRAQRFARQQALGIVPENAQLAPRDENVPAWQDLSDNERRFGARTQEAYAGFLHHTDSQLQRLVDFLERAGQLEDTIVMVMSDNGAGSWGPPAGRLDVHRAVYIEPEPMDELIANIDKVGSDQSQPSYGPGWAQASNTPLKFYKGDTYEGGIRAPLIVHWPGGGLPRGVICPQYHHVTDIVPTLLELADVPPEPVDGMSLAYTLDSPGAPTRKSVQFYETAGDRAIWIDGWKAVTQHLTNTPFEEDQWALYDSRNDFAEIHDKSAEFPARVEEMVTVWRQEAERNNVLPLEDDLLSLESDVSPTPRALYVFYPDTTRIDPRSAPDIFNYDFTMSADVDIVSAPGNGVLLASGDSMAGYEFLMRDGHVEFIYIYTRAQHYSLRSADPVPSGRHVLTLRGRKTSETSRRVEVFVDGNPSGSTEIPNMWEVTSLNAGVRCGENRGAPISRSYEGTFRFDQILERLAIALDV